MNRTIKEATVKRYHYDSHAQLTAYLHYFINAYNYGRRPKTLRGVTPYEYICKCWTNQPERLSLNPHHQMPGPIPRARCQPCGRARTEGRPFPHRRRVRGTLLGVVLGSSRAG
jgi:hypothetical protein